MTRHPAPTTSSTHHPDDPPVIEEALTTKEGWRRFVDRQPSPPHPFAPTEPPALPDVEQARLDQARRDYHAQLPLAHTPVIRQVMSTGRLLVQLNRNQVSARRGLIVSGASGTGKTTALTQLGRTHELAVRRRHPGPEGRNRLPVLYVTVPPAATPKMLAVEFARFLGLELSSRANLPEIVNAVCTTAAATRAELVLVDEIHNLNLATRSGAEVSDQLKYFAERLPATFAYAGVEVESQGLFAGVRGRQIAGRFTLINSAPFDHGTAEQRETWHGLIATLESMLRLHHHNPGSLATLAEYLFQRTGGMIGSLSQLIRGGAILAIEDGSEQITRGLLDLVPVDFAAERSAPARRPRSRAASKRASA
ncbi:ATP-binding protein [Alloactinosynnema sp. L-07]|uniref:ATP-binding protein n=1 Tax=Alloactinosynnema sp. L-07 TaxID=1653480 RepID=UPI0018D3476A|nr:ATP-binding protein [Alloactinosynnema sp. L-07]